MTAARDYAAAAEVLEGLGQAVKANRARLGMGLVATGRAAGVASSTVWRAEHGLPLNTFCILMLLGWLIETSEEK